jgi:crotonobetaine/carnitine-CoA ligase
MCVRPREPHRVFIGYFNNAEATMRAFRNLWYHTGDTGHFGEDGELYFDGRIGDTIRRRGVNISSDQIESELRKSELVRDCGVIGVPSETGEEEIHACVIWGQSSTPEQSDYELLMAHLSERLPRDYVPRYLEIVENLPRTDTGKVRKLELKRRPHFGRTWDRVDKIWVHS